MAMLRAKSPFRASDFHSTKLGSFRNSPLAWQASQGNPNFSSVAASVAAPAAGSGRTRPCSQLRNVAIFKSFDDIVDHCCYAWNTLIDQPWKSDVSLFVPLHRALSQTHPGAAAVFVVDVGSNWRRFAKQKCSKRGWEAD